MTSKKAGSTPLSNGAKKVDGRHKNRLTPALEKNKWKKGQSGNPAGRMPDSPELKKLKALTKSELTEVGNLIVKGDYVALKKMAKDDRATVLQRMLASVAQSVIYDGDMHKLDILLNRLVGKVKEEVNLTSNLPQVIVNLPSNGREVKDAN